MLRGLRLRRLVVAALCAALACLPLPRATPGQCMCAVRCEGKCCGAGCCCAGVNAVVRAPGSPSGSAAPCCHARCRTAEQQPAVHVADVSRERVASPSEAVEPQLASSGCRCGCCAPRPLPVVPQSPREHAAKFQAGGMLWLPLPPSQDNHTTFSGLPGQVFTRHARSLCVLLCVWRD